MITFLILGTICLMAPTGIMEFDIEINSHIAPLYRVGCYRYFLSLSSKILSFIPFIGAMTSLGYKFAWYWILIIWFVVYTLVKVFVPWIINFPSVVMGLNNQSGFRPILIMLLGFVFSIIGLAKLFHT